MYIWSHDRKKLEACHPSRLASCQFSLFRIATKRRKWKTIFFTHETSRFVVRLQSWVSFAMSSTLWVHSTWFGCCNWREVYYSERWNAKLAESFVYLNFIRAVRLYLCAFNAQTMYNVHTAGAEFAIHYYAVAFLSYFTLCKLNWLLQWKELVFRFSRDSRQRFTFFL